MNLPSTKSTLLARLRDTADHVAWQEFEERYRELLLRFCQRRGLQRVDAEDVVQNVLFNLAKGLPGFVYDPQRGKFRDYLFRATRNSITDWTRRTIGSPQALDTDVARTLASPTDESEGGDVALWEKEWVAHHYRLALLRARDEFEPRNLEIFERNVAGASVTELAVAYGIEEGSIYASRRRIRQRLRELIAEQVREEEA